MHQAREGPSFLTHEFNDAIAIQLAIVECGGELAGAHPDARTRRLLRDMNATDERHLEELRRLGEPYRATGELEDVAGGLTRLARTAARLAREADPREADLDAYEAHAVLLTLKRKQQDSAVAMLEIADAMRLTTLRDGVERLLLETRVTAAELSQAMASLAVRMATSQSPSQASRSA